MRGEKERAGKREGERKEKIHSLLPAGQCASSGNTGPGMFHHRLSLYRSGRVLAQSLHGTYAGERGLAKRPERTWGFSSWTTAIRVLGGAVLGTGENGSLCSHLASRSLQCQQQQKPPEKRKYSRTSPGDASQLSVQGVATLLC